MERGRDDGERGEGGGEMMERERGGRGEMMERKGGMRGEGGIERELLKKR